MTRSEQRAMEALPPRWRKSKYEDTKIDSRLPVRKFYIRAYEQAERDLALTWEDIERIEHYCEQVNREHNMGTFRGTPYGKSFFKEVARRFNKAKEENK